ncbi:MAG: lipid II flippase MurJ [Actinomycetota bacterium]
MEYGSRPDRFAAAIAGLTVASRALGFVRTLVVTSVLGLSFLGNVYATANSLPNLLFEIVAGGALAAVIVPSLAGLLTKGDRQILDSAASSFLNLALLTVTPLVVAGLFLREPLMGVLLSQVEDPGIRASQIELGSFFLLLFLPQIWLYTAGIVLTGVLHAYRRFLAPAVAPMLSSIVVTGVYLLYSFQDGTRDVTRITLTGKLILGAGTTLGVAILSLSLVVPAMRVGFRWGPILRVPITARRNIKGLLAAAVVAVALQQLFLGIVVVLGNQVEGGVVAYQLAFTALLLPWAVLAIPVITTSFPGLAAAFARGDEHDFAIRSSKTTSQIVWLTLGGSAVMVAAAGPALKVLLAFGPQGADPSLVIPTVMAFAPGLVGYGLYALLTRTAYASDNGRLAATASVYGFGLAIVLSLAAPRMFDGKDLIAAMAASFSVGTLVASTYLLVGLRSRRGPGIFKGFAVTATRGSAAAIIAGALGWSVSRLLPSGHLASNLLSTVLTVAAAASAYAVLASVKQGVKN